MRPRSKRATSRPVDADDRIIARLYCIKCGGNLQGELVTGVCAQCGHPASDSVFGDYLIYSDPSEIRRLSEATRVVTYAAAVLSVLFAIATLASISASESATDAVERAFDMLFAAVLLYPVIAVTGIILLTRRHAIAYYEARYLNARFLPRAGLVGVALLVGIGGLAYYFPYTVEAVLLGIWATWPSAAFLLGVARLMRRLPNMRLAGFARGICIGVYVVGGLTLVFLLFRRHAYGDKDWEGLRLALQFLTSWGWIAIAIMSFRLLTLVQRNFRAVTGK